MAQLFMPNEPPASLSEGEYDETLFDLCRRDNYAGLYREFIKRFGVKSTTIPNAQLRVMRQLQNPPKPIGLDVVVNGATVAVLDYATVKKAIDEYETLVAARASHVSDFRE